VAVSETRKKAEQMCMREACALESTFESPPINIADFGFQGLEKVIPDTPKGEVPVHLRDRQIFADKRIVVYPWEADVGISKKDAEAAKTKAP
jgi:hypothetical protein